MRLCNNLNMERDKNTLNFKKSTAVKIHKVIIKKLFSTITNKSTLICFVSKSLLLAANLRLEELIRSCCQPYLILFLVFLNWFVFSEVFSLHKKQGKNWIISFLFFYFFFIFSYLKIITPSFVLDFGLGHNVSFFQTLQTADEVYLG